jgi:mercuric ion binding protein
MKILLAVCLQLASAPWTVLHASSGSTFESVNAPPAAASEKVVTVKGMVCSFCAQGIQKKFKSMPEVEAVQVDLKAKTVRLRFKPGQSLDDARIAAILRDAGYEAVF